MPKKMMPLLISVVTVLCYFPAIKNGYIWDDDLYVTKNLTLLDLQGLKRIWSELDATPQYYPVTFTTFWLEYQIWELQPVGYHVVNILIHILNAILIGRIFERISIPGAWLAALIFAIHPVHVESVAWITERKNVLSTLFYLLSLSTYLRFSGIILNETQTPKDSSPQVRLYVTSLLFLLCALGSKTVTCTFPATILLIVWWKRGQIAQVDILPLLPFFLATFFMAGLTSWIEQNIAGATGGEWQFSFIERLLIAGQALWFYIGKLLWPHPLIFTYPRWTLDTTSIQYIYPLSFLLLLFGLWKARFRIGRGPLTAILFFSGTLVPALGFVNFYPMRFSFVADHFQYLASISLIGLVASRISQWVVQRSVLRVLVFLLLAGYGVLTWNQTQVYQSAETLWKDTIAKNPKAWMAHNNLAAIMKQKGDLRMAKAHFAEALRIKPDYDEPYNNLGLILFDEQKFDAAIEYFKHLLKNNPDHLEGLNNMGLISLALGEMESAKNFFHRAIRLNPGYFKARNNLGLTLARTGKWDQAIYHFKIALTINPHGSETHHNLGLVFAEKGRWDKAKYHLQTALALEPGSQNAKKDLEKVIAMENIIRGTN